MNIIIFSVLTNPFNVFQPSDHCFQLFFDGFGVTQPSPLNDFQPPDHWFQWFFDGFGVLQPLASMVFNGNGPLVQRCDGFNVSFTSNQDKNLKPSVHCHTLDWNKDMLSAHCLTIENPLKRMLHFCYIL